MRVIVERSGACGRKIGRNQNSSLGSIPAFSKFSFAASSKRITFLHHPNAYRQPSFQKLPLRLKPHQRSISPTARSSSKRALADATSEGPPAKVQRVSEAPGVRGDNVPASPLSAKDKRMYEKRTKFTPSLDLHRRRRLANNVGPVWTGMPASAQKGMRNLTGVLCYRNSLLQSLLHQPQFCRWLIAQHEPQHCIWVGKTPCVACGLRDLVQAYWSGKISVDLALKDVDKAFRANAWKKGHGGQEDPEEQLTWLVNKFSEQLPKQHYAVFEALNRFVLDSSTTCKACNHTSSKLGDIEGTLAIDLLPRMKNGSLSSYIQQYLNYSVSGYRCESCTDTKSDKQRSRKLAHSPDFFTVQLKRFDCLGRKDSYPIPVDKFLDLNSARTLNNKSDSNYELSATVLHSGSLKSGHYICRTRGADGKWREFDDTYVESISERTALDPGRKGGFTPYLLFYQRVRK